MSSADGAGLSAARALRIGMVCPYSLTIPGGVQAQALGLARELRKLGHEVRVLGPCDGPPPESFVTPLGDSLPLAANGSIVPLAPDLPAALRTMQTLRDEAFDVLHLHEPLVPGPTVTALVLHATPIVATFHAAGTSTSYRFLKLALSRLINRIDQKVVVSKDALTLVRDHLGGEYEVLFNGVELDQIRATRALETEPRDPPTVFFCGRHEERKGLRVLIEAFETENLDARLWIASDGPETSELQERTQDDQRFVWLGRVSDEEKFARLKAADAFCAPSLKGESFGVVLIEAMAAGTPVVASSLDGYRNVATDGIDAVLVSPGDVPALSAALRAVLADDELAERLRAGGLVRAEEFDMRLLAEHYVALYRRVLGRSAISAIAE